MNEVVLGGVRFKVGIGGLHGVTPIEMGYCKNCQTFIRGEWRSKLTHDPYVGLDYHEYLVCEHCADIPVVVYAASQKRYPPPEFAEEDDIPF